MAQVVDFADFAGTAAPPAQPKGLPSNLTQEEVGRYVQTESGGRSDVVSPKGAQGDLQVMPKTQTDPGLGVRPAKDKSPGELHRVGVDYLSALKRRYNNDPALTAIAYNWGLGHTDKWLARGADPRDLPKETRDYVKKVGAGRGLAQIPGGVPKEAPSSGIVSAEEFSGKPSKQAPTEAKPAEGKETFRGQRLLMEAAAVGDLGIGYISSILGMEANAVTTAIGMAHGKDLPTATHEGRIITETISNSIGNPLRAVMEHFMPGEGEKKYDEGEIHKKMGIVSKYLEKGIDYAHEKTGISRDNLENARDWLMVMGPKGVARVGGKILGKIAGKSEAGSKVNAPLVEKYAKVGEEAEAPKSADGTKASSGQMISDEEPPLAEGKVRLYHGSAEHGRYEGKAWFSTSKEYAQNYRQGAELQYVDVPAEKVNAILDPDNYGQTVEKGFTLNHEFDSSEVGARKPLTRAKGVPPAPQPGIGKAPLPPPEKAPLAPIGQRVGAEAKTRLAEPPIIGEKPGPAPSGPPIYTGAKAPLDTGLAKVKAGQMFDLTAEERIALRQAGPSKLGKLGGQAGKADPKLLAKIALATGGAAAGAYFADRDKLEGAIAGGVAGVAATLAPRYASAVRSNWKGAMAATATTAGLTAGLAYLDREHPMEGALIGLAWGATRAMPKKTLSRINDLTIDDRANLYYGALRANTRDVDNITRSLKLLVPDAERRAQLSEIIESGKAGTLTGQERTAAMAFRGFMDSYKDAAQHVGLLHDFVENYVTHIVEKEGLPKTKVQEVMDALFGEPKLGPTGGAGRFTKARKYETFADLEKALEGTGLKVATKDLAEIAEIYGQSMGKAIEAKRYIDNLKGAYGPDGKQSDFIMDRDKAPTNYQTIDHPQMRGLAVHPEIADSLKFTLEKDNPGAAKAGFLTASMATKRLGTSFSYFHLENMATAQIGAMGKDAFWGINKAIEAYRNGGSGDSVDDLLRGGLNLGSHTVGESAVGALRGLGQAIDSVGQRAIGKKLGGEKVLGGIEAVQRKAFDNIIWNYAHPGLKLNNALYEYEKALRKHPEAFPDENATPEQIAKAKAVRADLAKQVSSFVNDTYGGLDWYRVATESNNDTIRKFALSQLSPKGRGTLQILMFAPDWTFSTFRSVYKALPGASDMPLTRALHQKYVLRSGIMMMGVNNFFNYANTGHSVFQNKNKDGSPDWFRVHLKDGTTMDGFRHANEAYRLMQDPRGMVISKLGYLPKTAGEVLFQKEYLTAKKGIGPPMEEGTISHMIKGMTPFSVPQATPGRGITDVVERAALGMVGVPRQGTTEAERQAMKRERDKKKREKRS